MTNYYLIFDIKTTGFPKDWDGSVHEFDNWPRIIEIAWQLYDDKRNLVNEKSFLIRPDGYDISEDIEKLTGISFDEANEVGVSLMNSLQEFTSVFLKFNPTLIAHNCEFDINVIQAHLINNNFPQSLDEYRHICTMKESATFCDLPNLKYPKLHELYNKLFSEPPSKSHRALADVKTTSKSFFKLLDIGVIELKQTNQNAPFDINILKSDEVIQAIRTYTSDLNKYPIFYDFNEVSVISDDSLVKQVQDDFNKFYQTTKAKTFEIPYNLVINRVVTALKTKDVIVRYLLMNYLKKETNFITSTEKYDEDAINIISEGHLKEGKQIVIKVDITNCYESIDHEQLIKEISNSLNIETTSLYSTVLNSSLKVIYEDLKGSVIRKEKGLLIGSKPDEYFAEYFLEQIKETIENKGIDVIRVADEFIYFSNSIDSARKDFKIVSEIIESYKLNVNNSKTTVTDHRDNTLKNKLDFKLVMVGATNPYLAYKLSDIVTKDNNSSEDKAYSITEKGSNQKIDSYDSALLFLKQLLFSQLSIEKYQEKHPKYKYLNNIVFSQPTDFRNDFFVTDTSIFSKSNVEKLKKVILYYPKSEYYTAIALQVLAFLATNSVHTTDRMDINNTQLEDFALSQHETCVESNSTIIDLLRSNDIHEYQKYILLRCLFKKKNGLQLGLNEYEVKEVRYNFFDDLGIANNIPFKENVLAEVQVINQKTNYYPLKMICSEIISISD